MVQITQGKVIYSRTIQPAQYESKKAEVELTFVLAEGEDLGNALDETAEIVKAKALEMVGIKTVKSK
jgi:hypothetical protein